MVKAASAMATRPAGVRKGFEEDRLDRSVRLCDMLSRLQLPVRPLQDHTR